MLRRRLVLAAACAATLAGCASTGTADVTAEQVVLAPLPTVGGVGVLPSTVVPPKRETVVPVPVITRPVSVETHAEHGRHAVHGAEESGGHGNGTAHPVDVPAQRTGATDK